MQARIDRPNLPVVLAVLFLSAFMALLDVTVVTVAIPTISSDLSAGLADQQWVISAYTLLFSAFLLTGGALGDRYGTKRVLLASVAGFVLASAGCGFAPSIGVLLAARAVQGLFGAAMLPGTLSMISQIFPDPKARARAIGMWSGVAGLALIAGPLLGGWLVGSYGWRSIFFLNLPIGVAVIAVGLRVLPKAGGRRAALDPVGQAAAIVWIGALAYALIQGNTDGWTSRVIIAMFVVAAVGFVAFLVVELRGHDPVLPIGLFRERPFLVGNVVSFLLGFGLFSMFFFLSLYMQQIRGESALATGLSFLPGSVAIVLTAPLSGMLAGRFGTRVPMTLGLLIAGVSLLSMHRMTVTSVFGSYWWCILLMGIGIGLALSPTTAMVLSVAPPGRSGSGASIANTHRQVGIVFGVAVLGSVLTERFTSLVRADLASAGVPLAERNTIAHEFLTQGGRIAQSAGSGPAGQLVATAAKSAFVAGLHDVLTIGGVALLVAAVAAPLLLGGRRQPGRADSAQPSEPVAVL